MIKRYDLLETGSQCSPEEIECDDGEWVKYEDLNEENKWMKSQLYADDGFNPPVGPCSECGSKQTVIRPGDIRCMTCENHNFLIEENQQLEDKIEKAKKVVLMVTQIDSYMDIEAPFHFQELWDLADETLIELNK